MPLAFDQHSRTNDITRAIVRLIAAGGMERVTMRAVAQGVRLSLGSLTNHLTNRERMLRVCASQFIDWRRDDLTRRLKAQGLVAAIPSDEEQLALTRVELAWREAARCDENIAYSFGRYDAELRLAIDRAVDAGAQEETPEILLALVLGLWDAMCRPADQGMPVEQAQRTLAAAASALARSSPTMVSGSAAE